MLDSNVGNIRLVVQKVIARPRSTDGVCLPPGEPHQAKKKNIRFPTRYEDPEEPDDMEDEQEDGGEQEDDQDDDAHHVILQTPPYRLLGSSSEATQPPLTPYIPEPVPGMQPSQEDIPLLPREKRNTYQVPRYVQLCDQGCSTMGSSLCKKHRGRGGGRK